MTRHKERIRREIERAALRGCRSPLASHPISVRAKRKMYEAVTSVTRPLERLQWRREVVGGVPVERTVSVGASATLIYLHGETYGPLSAYRHRGVAGRLAEAAWMAVVVPEYSSSREPVVLEELVEVYTALLADGMDPRTTVIAGESAGGGLTLELAMTLRDRGIVLPAALGLICPTMTPEDANFAGLPPVVLHEADCAIAELGVRLRAHVQDRVGP